MYNEGSRKVFLRAKFHYPLKRTPFGKNQLRHRLTDEEIKAVLLYERSNYH